MKQKDVQNTDLLPGVDIVVVGAFPRLIDLQSSGYSYIKFE
jgi:intracellular sulfur oxidation DsrE/DsrF family protein